LPRPIGKALQSVTPGILSPLGTILGILIAFLAVRVRTNLDHAQEHIGRELSALREVVMLVDSLPVDVRARVREAIGKHLEAVVSEDWPAVAEARISLRSFPPRISRKRWMRSFPLCRSGPTKLVKSHALTAVERRNRVAVSRAEIAPVQWAVIVVLAGLILVTIAAIHINVRPAMAVTMFVFSTAVAMCLVLLMVYDRPFGSGGFSLLAADCLSRGDAKLTAPRRD
jgi:hypothetical protein